ncbi:glycoside hydrolase family 172 protein [Bacteroides sedimenti]
MKTRKALLLCLSIYLLVTPFLMVHGQQKKIDFRTLLEEIISRESIAQYPIPYYSCRQFSSYDRSSVKPGDKSWFANWDRSMFIRTEINNGKKEYVMMDTQGPGSIVRFWMTFAGENAGNGILRIYFDHRSKPAIEGKALDILSGGKLAGKPLSTSVSDSTEYNMRGHNLYLPLPYSKHCKVTYESENIKDFGAKTGGEAVYYNINYRTYTKGTNVTTWSSKEMKSNATLLKKVQQVLLERKVNIPSNSKNYPFSGNLAPGQSIKVPINEKNSSIRRLCLNLSADRLEQALRSTLLEISFDGNKTVKCPIGDFFGTGYLLRTSDTWYTKVLPDGTLQCQWVMPLKSNCIFIITNNGTQNVNISSGKITTAPYPWSENTMYFGCAWQQYSKLHTGEMKNNEGDGAPFDINYITLKGKGVYVGDAITLFNTVYAWWGEGDEKIYIDNETFPSHFGTGTEDYYGYAWCRPERFNNHPFIAQPDGSGNFNPGYTNDLRFRVLDAIPFKRNFKFDMEMWHWTKAIINFAPTTFWYLLPHNKKCESPSDLKEARENVVLQRNQLISQVITNNKIEGENLDLINMSGGNFRYSNSVERSWSNNMQLVWEDTKLGDKLHLTFISEKEYTCNFKIVYSMNKDYGKFRISINQNDSAIIDGKAENFSLGNVILKSVRIKKGMNHVYIEPLEQSDSKSNKIGLDYIGVEHVEK